MSLFVVDTLDEYRAKRELRKTVEAQEQETTMKESLGYHGLPVKAIHGLL